MDGVRTGVGQGSVPALLGSSLVALLSLPGGWLYCPEDTGESGGLPGNGTRLECLWGFHQLEMQKP